MNNAPFFSIVIPTYNRAGFLTEAIQSVINQIHSNWECIVVDDGSTDKTEEVISGFKDSRIKYYKKRNEERSAARNYGIERSKGKYICFLDSDDIYYSHHLSTLYKKLEKENFPVGIFNTGMNENRDGHLKSRPVFDDRNYQHPVYFIWKNFMLPTSVCTHSSILKKEKFPEKYNVWEDTHLWLRVVAQYPFYQIEKVTTQWNRHNGSSVSQAFNRVNYSHVKNYLNCISDLFANHGNLLADYLTEEDKQDYQGRKLRLFLRVALEKNQISAFIELYFYGIRNLHDSKLHKFVALVLKDHIKKQISLKKEAK